MKSIKDLLENVYLNKRIRLYIGDISKDQYVTATVTGFSVERKRKCTILHMKDIEGSNTYLKIMFRNNDTQIITLDTKIELIRDININEILKK